MKKSTRSLRLLSELLIVSLCTAGLVRAEQSIAFGEAQAGLRIGLVQARAAANSTPYRVKLIFENTGDKTLKLLRFSPQHAELFGLSVELIDPKNRPVKPFEWESPFRAQNNLDAAAEDYLELKPGQREELDVTAILFEEPGLNLEAELSWSDAPPDAIDSRWPPGPAGARRYGMPLAGTYRLKLTYAPTKPNLQKTPADLWQGRVESGELELRRSADGTISGRLAGYLKKAREGRKLKPISCTFFGGPDNEEFVGGGAQPDGTIVVFGNAWGDRFPDLEVPVKVLGRGEWYPVNPYAWGNPVSFSSRSSSLGGMFNNAGKLTPVQVQIPGGWLSQQRLDGMYPNRSGTILFYNEDLSKMKQALRFDWGVASIESGAVGQDGGIFICGRATEHFRSFAEQEKTKLHKIPMLEESHMGKEVYQGIFLPGDVYVAKLNAEASRFEWIYLFAGHRDVSELFPDIEGGVSFQINGLKRVNADGSEMQEIKFSGGGGPIRAISPWTREIIRGGDFNSGTGREPWRRPYCYYYKSFGQMVWSLYEWGGGLVGHDRFRQVSDSSVRGAAFTRDNTIWLYGWSDGGNTILDNNPLDLADSKIPRDHFGMSIWGATVGSFCHLIHMDPSNYQVIRKITFASYFAKKLPTGEFQDKPNSISLRDLLPLSDGGLAIWGGSASYLIQTPDPFFISANKDWGDHTPGGTGTFFTVMDKDFSTMFFSSAVPALNIAKLVETSRGILAIGTSTGYDNANHQGSPSINALQPKFGGGQLDGHLILIEKP